MPEFLTLLLVALGVGAITALTVAAISLHRAQRLTAGIRFGLVSLALATVPVLAIGVGALQPEPSEATDANVVFVVPSPAVDVQLPTLPTD